MKIKNLKITGFRAFSSLNVEDAGRVNLVTGKNNAGKSSLLEAIRLHATEGSPSTFLNILNYREETGQLSDDYGAPFTPEDVGGVCSLFHGFPYLADCFEPMTICSEDDGGNVSNTSIKVGWFQEQFDPESGRNLVEVEPDLFGEASGFPALEIESANRVRRLRLDRLNAYRRRFPESNEGFAQPCVFLDPFSSRSTNQLGSLWDAIALTDSESEVVSALQIISPAIQAVSMIGSDSSSRSRTAIAKNKTFPHPVPIKSFGDGVNRLFGLILSLTSAKGGILLVDEIENGLHYSILNNVWTTIFKMARKLNVQVFATSHSWDCIDAFQKAAQESPEDGALIRLTATEDNVIATVFQERELEIASREKIELR